MKNIKNKLGNLLMLTLKASSIVQSIELKMDVKQALPLGMAVMMVPIGPLAAAKKEQGQADIHNQNMKKMSIRQIFTAGLLIALIMPTMALSAENVTLSPLVGKANVIMTFDDGWTNYSGVGGADLAQPILKANNQSAVAFIIEEPVVGGWGSYMTISQIQSLYNDGWDISSHSLTHGSNHCPTPDTCDPNYLLNANDSEFKSEMGDSKNWLDTYGFTRSSMFFAYPYGVYNSHDDGTETGSLIARMKASGYYISGRSVDEYSWRYSNLHPNFVLGGAGTMIMPTLSTDSNSVNPNVPVPVADVLKAIDDTIQENGLLILTFHKITLGAPANVEEYNIGDFQNISNYLKARNDSGNVQVVTFSQYFNVPKTIPTYIPNNATLMSVTTGKTWMNIAWTDGAGNKTDVYEVLANGKQNYYITNRSFNITGLLPGQSVRATIDAVNTSWGKYTKNIAPLVVNAILPIYTPSAPKNISSTIGPNWVRTEWNPGDGINKTDFYNVSVTVQSITKWNITANTFINTTGISPGQPVLVKVYALNGTVGAATMNETPAILETTVPGTNSPIILSNISDNGNFSMNWTYKAGLNTDSVEININNFGIIDNRIENLKTNETGTVVLTGLTPHAVVSFGIRGKNQTTGLYSDYVYANQTLGNNPVVLSNLSDSYQVTKGKVLTINPISTDPDHDVITFGTTKINESTIDKTTGIFVFDTTNASLGKYNINITADDGHGSNATNKVSIIVSTVFTTPCCSGGSSSSSGSGGSGGGASASSDEPLSNIAKYESKDGYIQAGKDTIFLFTTLNPGIYQIFLGGQSQEIVVRVDNLRGHQNKTTDAPGHVLLYTSVMINSVRINEFSFSFKINKSDTHDVNSVKALVWNNGTWETLDTKVISTSDNSVYFQAKSTPAKVSKFAISELSQELSSPYEKTDKNNTNTTNAVKLAGDSNLSTNPNVQKSPGFEVVGTVLVLSIMFLRRKL